MRMDEDSFLLKLGTDFLTALNQDSVNQSLRKYIISIYIRNEFASIYDSREDEIRNLLEKWQLFEVCRLFPSSYIGLELLKFAQKSLEVVDNNTLNHHMQNIEKYGCFSQSFWFLTLFFLLSGEKLKVVTLLEMFFNQKNIEERVANQLLSIYLSMPELKLVLEDSFVPLRVLSAYQSKQEDTSFLKNNLFTHYRTSLVVVHDISEYDSKMKILKEKFSNWRLSLNDFNNSNQQIFSEYPKLYSLFLLLLGDIGEIHSDDWKLKLCGFLRYNPAAMGDKETLLKELSNFVPKESSLWCVVDTDTNFPLSETDLSNSNSRKAFLSFVFGVISNTQTLHITQKFIEKYIGVGTKVVLFIKSFLNYLSRGQIGMGETEINKFLQWLFNVICKLKENEIQVFADMLEESLDKALYQIFCYMRYRAVIAECSGNRDAFKNKIGIVFKWLLCLSPQKQEVEYLSFVRHASFQQILDLAPTLKGELPEIMKFIKDTHLLKFELEGAKVDLDDCQNLNTIGTSSYFERDLSVFHRASYVRSQALKQVVRMMSTMPLKYADELIAYVLFFYSDNIKTVFENAQDSEVKTIVNLLSGVDITWQECTLLMRHVKKTSASSELLEITFSRILLKIVK